jgi:hypothetical protein
MIRSDTRLLTVNVALALACFALVPSATANGAVPGSSPAGASPNSQAGSARRILPDVLPSGVPGGTIDTPLGTARWVRLTGDPLTLPEPLVPQLGRSGPVWFDGGGARDIPCEDARADGPCTAELPPRLWTAEDATSPRAEHALPVEAANAALFLDGDTFWLASGAPVTLWRSLDLAEWEQVDISGLVSPGPQGLEWDVVLDSPVTSAGGTLVPVTYFVHDPGRLVGEPGASVFLEPLEGSSPRGYRVSEFRPRSEGGPRELGTVRVEDTPMGIRISDEDGESIVSIEGVGPEFVERWAERGVIEERQLGIVEGGALTTVELPGWPVEDGSAESPTFFPLGSGFLALQIHSDHTVRTWRSYDGRSWAEGERLRGPDGQLLEGRWISWAGSPERSDIQIGTLGEPTAGGPAA